MLQCVWLSKHLVVKLTTFKELSLCRKICQMSSIAVVKAVKSYQIRTKRRFSCLLQRTFQPTELDPPVCLYCSLLQARQIILETQLPRRPKKQVCVVLWLSNTIYSTKLTALIVRVEYIFCHFLWCSQRYLAITCFHANV